MYIFINIYIYIQSNPTSTSSQNLPHCLDHLEARRFFSAFASSGCSSDPNISSNPPGTGTTGKCRENLRADEHYHHYLNIIWGLDGAW